MTSEPLVTINTPAEAALALVALWLICFLIGSIPWGFVISKVAYHKDIRSAGSGNIGATNALRTLGKKGGLAVFVLDFCKGIVAGILATTIFYWMLLLSTSNGYPAVIELPLFSYVMGNIAYDGGYGHFVFGVTTSIAMCGVVWGHIFSPWLKFKGGKGISASIGLLFFAFGLVGALCELAIFIVFVAITRYVSLGSIMAALLCIVIAFIDFWGNWFAVGMFTLTAITVLWAHRANIKRLFNGTESKISFKKQSAGESEGLSS